MKNLFDIFNKITTKDTREWYAADMIAPNGTPYRKGVKANNKAEAYGIIALGMPEGNKIVKVEKGDL